MVASSMNTAPPASSSSSSDAAGALVPSASLMPASLWRPIFSALAAASIVPVMIIFACRRSDTLLCARVTFSNSATSSAAAWKSCALRSPVPYRTRLPAPISSRKLFSRCTPFTV